VETYGRAGQVTDENALCIACCIPKATNTNFEYVPLNDFSLQQW